MGTRQLKITGNKVTDTVTADVTINGVVVYSGELGSTLNKLINDNRQVPAGDLIVVQYDGSDHRENLLVEISVTDGCVLIGPFTSDVIVLPAEQLAWRNDTILSTNVDNNDGRSNIKINDTPPNWELGAAIRPPGGTQDNPSWRGWTFEVGTRSVFSCNYSAWPATVTINPQV